LKGITIYRDRSRDSQVLVTGKKEKKEAAEGEKATAVITHLARPRAKITRGVTERVTTGCGHLYITVNSDEQGICEVFSHLGKTGGCAAAQLEASCRLISYSLRSGIDAAEIVRALRGIRCPSPTWEDGKSVLSCADAIASVLEKYVTGTSSEPKAEGKNLKNVGPARNLAGQCPDCGSLLVYQEGCFICPACAYTKC
jgi:ribonucleoside-diphosphate reductase alpha chain